MINNSIMQQFSSFFENIYFCDRAWSAWGYGTMTQNDFLPISEDEEYLKDILKDILKKEITSENIEEAFNNTEAYFCDDIENCFSQEYFAEDFLSYIDWEELVPFLLKLKINLSFNNF